MDKFYLQSYSPIPVINETTNITIGDTNLHIKITTKSIKKNPAASINLLYFAANSGKRAKSTFDPSSGGIGIILNTANTTLITVIAKKISTNADENDKTPEKRTSNPNTSARRMFETGPASATIASPHRL